MSLLVKMLESRLINWELNQLEIIGNILMRESPSNDNVELGHLLPDIPTAKYNELEQAFSNVLASHILSNPSKIDEFSKEFSKEGFITLEETINGQLVKTFFFFIPPDLKQAIEERKNDLVPCTKCDALAFRNPDKGTDVLCESCKSMCFIATSCYGSSNCKEVIVLRSFRDKYLLATKLGIMLVHSYYSLSPAIAAFVSNHTFIRNCIRTCLIQPIVLFISTITKM